MSKIEEAIEKSIHFILSNQNPDGGWGPDEISESDGWSTGEVLYTLKTVGKTSGEHLRRGINWLVSNQNDDGSWWSITFGKTTRDGKRIGDVPTTACAVLGLIESESKFHQVQLSINKGMNWLLELAQGLPAGGGVQPFLNVMVIYLRYEQKRSDCVHQKEQ